MKIKYYSVGLMSLKEGMTFTFNVHNDDGDLIAGVPNPEKSLFKCKEISKDEYDAYMQMMIDPNVPKGFAGGIINDKGKEDIMNFYDLVKKEKIEKNESKIALSVKKIKKLLALEIIDQEDIDTEIEQQNMLEFKDEIKKRLETN